MNHLLKRRAYFLGGPNSGLPVDPKLSNLHTLVVPVFEPLNFSIYAEEAPINNPKLHTYYRFTPCIFHTRCTFYVSENYTCPEHAILDLLQDGLVYNASRMLRP